MRLNYSLAGCIAAAALFFTPVATGAKSNQSAQIQPSTFTPPQTWRNTNLVRNIDLSKGYVRESINIVIENLDKAPQDEYFLPLNATIADSLGGFEVRDRADPNKPPFETRLVDSDKASTTDFYLIRLPVPVQPNSQLTLSVSYHVLAQLSPLPAKIEQTDKQYLYYAFSAYAPSSYVTLKQRTKLKLPTADTPDYTVLPAGGAVSSENKQDPIKQGTSLTYGPFGEAPAGVIAWADVRYDFTRPVNVVETLERDLEVSHWGGNLATEERYKLTNQAAAIKGHFNRVQYAATAYYNPPSSALREIVMTLPIGSTNPYFIDDVGNVSTSRYRSNAKEARLELKPRYPIFGNWHYKFKVGWDRDLDGVLRKLKTGDGYILRVPFLEGPRVKEGVSYGKATIKVVLPEGATNIRHETSVPVISAEQSIHHSFMDTTGRTALTLTAVNLIDDYADKDLIITYDYPFTAGLRKPVTIVAAVMAIFVATYALSLVDVSITSKR